MAKEKTNKLWRIAKRIVLWIFIGQFAYIILLRWVNPPITITELVSVIRGHGLIRSYVSLNEMSPDAKLAVMASEDQLFPDHDGFDIKAIKLAQKFNKKHPSRIRGASTISQQVAKNVFLWQHGGYFRKALEVYFTFMIETFWGKKRILEMYLNVAQTGDGIFGIEAAANNYFSKPALSLSRIEAAEIAAALPNPVKIKVKPLSAYAASRAQAIVRQMGFLEDDPEIAELIKNKGQK